MTLSYRYKGVDLDLVGEFWNDELDIFSVLVSQIDITELLSPTDIAQLEDLLLQEREHRINAPRESA